MLVLVLARVDVACSASWLLTWSSNSRQGNNEYSSEEELARPQQRQCCARAEGRGQRCGGGARGQASRGACWARGEPEVVMQVPATMMLMMIFSLLRVMSSSYKWCICSVSCSEVWVHLKQHKHVSIIIINHITHMMWSHMKSLKCSKGKDVCRLCCSHI